MVDANYSLNGHLFKVTKIHTWIGIADIKAFVTQCFGEFHTAT